MMITAGPIHRKNKTHAWITRPLPVRKTYRTAKHKSESEFKMDLSKYEGKHVRIRDIYGSVFTGIAGYGNYEFLMHEYGGDEDGIFIEDCLVYNSQIASIEEITVHGTAELWTDIRDGILTRHRKWPGRP